MMPRLVPRENDGNTQIMRVFVTGATGFVGAAVVQELIGAGHQVLGLARSEKSAEALRAAGADVQLGSLEDLESLRSGAANADGVIHCGFVHDFAHYEESCAKDRRAIETIGEVLSGTGKPFVVTSGTAMVKSGQFATEDIEATPEDSGMIRAASEVVALALAEKGVRVSILRLPPSVHGEGDHGFVPALIGIAREKGESAYIENGANRWPGVHRIDAARLYRLALENGIAGSRYHAAESEGVPTHSIAELIGRRLDLPIVSKSHEEALAHFGWLAHFFMLDNPTSSEKTRNELNWAPTQLGLLEDVDHDYYF